VIDLEEKCRKMKISIAQKPKRVTDEPKPTAVTGNDIEEYKAKCKEAERAKLEEEKVLKLKVKEVERTVKSTQDNIDALNT
jgi:hypothetical protein